MKNIFISGEPRCGKTTLIKEIIEDLKLEAGGFYTSEIREAGERIGFEIRTLNGRKGILAHKDFQSPYRVGSYKVNIKDLEEIGVSSILKVLKEGKPCTISQKNERSQKTIQKMVRGKVIIIDEIGKMEMKSSEFKQAVLAALASENRVLGTLKLTPDSFTDKVRKRKDVKIFYLTKENKEEVKKEIIKNYQPR